jgi:hypothetical protein
LLHDASKEMNATSKQMRMIFSMSPIVNNARNLNSKNGVATLVALFGAVAEVTRVRRCCRGAGRGPDGSDTYRIEKDFAPRSKPSHEEGLRIGGREIGLIRISKRISDA